MSAMQALIVALSGLLLSSTLRAEAPMVTEHTDPLAVGECEWEVFAEGQRAGGAKARGWSTNAGCGLVKNLDIGLGIGQWRVDGLRERALELYGRWRLHEGGDDSASVALVYGLEVLKSAGQGWRHDTTQLMLAVDQPVADGLLGRLNLGVSHSRLSRESTRLWALGADWSLSEQFDLVAETYGAQGSKPWQGLGLRWKPAEGWSFGLMGSRSRDGQRAWLLSAQWVH